MEQWNDGTMERCENGGMSAYDVTTKLCRVSINNNKAIIMKAIGRFLVTGVAYFFAVLFIYAAASKMFDFENFQVQLAQSPLLSAYAGFISYAVIVLEVMIGGVLVDPKVRRIGLYASFGLMVAFTVYIYLILNHSDFVPCSCGGILEKMGWTEHLIFNVTAVGMSLLAIVFIGKKGAIHFRRTAAVSSLIFVISGGGMVALFLSSEYIMKKENNFTRRFPQHPITEETRYDLGVNSYYFAGESVDRIYLSNTSSPLLLTGITKNFAQKNSMFINPPTSNLLFTAPRMQVVEPYYYFYDGTTPIIYRGELNSPKIKTKSYFEAYFNQLVIIDSLIFAIRTVAIEPKHFALGEINAYHVPRFSLHDELLPRHVQSLFETDGSLIRDAVTADLVYTYSYQNKFEVIDSVMTSKKQFNTIDKTELSPLPVKTLANGDKRLQSPPPKVNKKSFVFGGVLFIESNAIGKFESKKSWKEASVIDMYATTKQEYLGSFYLYRRGNSKLTDLMITDDQLYVIMGSDLISYRLAPSITKHFQTGEAENLQTE